MSEKPHWTAEEFWHFCDNMKKHELKVALDDFGTHGANLVLIGNGYPQIIKIAKELVVNCDNDVFKKTIITEFLEILVRMKIEIIIEGIETSNEFKIFERYPVLFQGFFFSEPKTFEEMTKK